MSLVVYGASGDGARYRVTLGRYPQRTTACKQDVIARFIRTRTAGFVDHLSSSASPPDGGFVGVRASWTSG